MSDTAGTWKRHIIKKAMIAVAPIEEKIEVVLASDYDVLHAQAVALATEITEVLDGLSFIRGLHQLTKVAALRRQAQALLDAQGRKG